MNNSLFYNHVDKNEYNKEIIEQIEMYSRDNPHEQIYLLTAPLGEKYNYEYEKYTIVILSPKHKIIFLDLNKGKQDFEDYYEDFLEDLSSLSDKFNYKNHIGRPRLWKDEVTVQIELDSEFDFANLLQTNLLIDNKLKRKSELLISLLIGSINNIEEIGAEVPETILEKVKKNITLFDGDQTRFIYKDFPSKTVSIQGLSGTGKTELLLHKLKDLYLADDKSKIFFTCHNIALANTIHNRIPNFFNFMKVEKQIEWKNRLWVNRAWGSQKDKDSGLYSYLCHFYNIPFFSFNFHTNYEFIFSRALEAINKIDDNEFEYAFDYILIDERQDFPKVFFDLCEKVARKKVYIAGDIFQDIFENVTETELRVDVILNKCYRTDPRTLMFSHAVGMGLFEEKKFNWFSDDQWEAMGYHITREGRNVQLSREPIRRFEDLDAGKIESVIVEKYNGFEQIINILQSIRKDHPTVTPNDVAIIVLDSGNHIYEYIDMLGYQIIEQVGWEINRAYDTKIKVDDTLFITNINNVKGLEFPFVICFTEEIKDDYKYRNTLYTMLTRSFIQSYFLVHKDTKLQPQIDGLKVINNNNYISTSEPTQAEKEEIKNTIIKIQEELNLSYRDFLNRIFDELKIPKSCRKKLEKGLIDFEIEQFNEEQTKHYIETNKHYCK